MNDPAFDTSTALIMQDLMTPSLAIGYFDEGIHGACEGYAPVWNFDADELYAASTITQSERNNNILTYGNSDWSIEMYFVYSEGTTPDADKPAGYWAVAMRDGSELSAEVAHYISVSSVLSVLYAADPQMDLDAASAMIRRGEDRSVYYGNGYRLMFVVIDSSETQLIVERS